MKVFSKKVKKNLLDKKGRFNLGEMEEEEIYKRCKWK